MTRLYIKEAQTLAALDHPGIVPVYDVGSSPYAPCYVVSKLIDGADLASHIKKQSLQVDQAVELVITVAQSLHFAHGKGFVHRDVKPGNILIDKQGRPYLADFGLALDDDDLLGLADRTEPVRNDERRATTHEFLEAGLDEGLAFTVQARRRFVEDEDLGIREQRPRDGHALSLAT